VLSEEQEEKIMNVANPVRTNQPEYFIGGMIKIGRIKLMNFSYIRFRDGCCGARFYLAVAMEKQSNGI
jgi:hypothetical protein